MDSQVTPRDHAPRAPEPISMSDSLLSRILKMPDEGNCEDGNASSDFSSDLHTVDDWFKSKNDSMSGLDFDSDLKNSELDIGDLFNLKGMLHINQLSSNECAAANSQVKIEQHSLGIANSGRPECSGQNYYEKYLALPSGALKASSFPLDKGIFEEMLLADSVQRLYKNKNSPFDASDAMKNLTDSEETLLPAFQELLTNNSSVERKEIIRLAPNSNLPALSLDFEVHSPVTASDQPTNLVHGPFWKTKLNKDVSHLCCGDERDSLSREQCSIKNLLASSALSELCMDDLRCHELSASDEITNLPSEFFSASSSNSIDTDSRLSSILALNAHETEADETVSSCKDILDTIDKNFLKADLGINPNPDLRPSKWSYETTLSDGSLLVCSSVIDGENGQMQTSSLSTCEKSAECDLINKEMIISDSSTLTTNSMNIFGEDASKIAFNNRNSSVFERTESSVGMTEKASLCHLSSEVVTAAEESKSVHLPSWREAEVITESVMNSKSTQINCSLSSNECSYKNNPILKLIQDQKNSSPSSQSFSPLLSGHLEDHQLPVPKSVPVIQPSLVFSAVKSHDKKITLPQNLLRALQESYKTDVSPKIAVSSLSASHSPLQRKVVRITQSSSPKNLGHTLPKICINKARVFGDEQASSIKAPPKVINGWAPHKGFAKVVMSVDPKANLTSVLVTSSNKELTVFKINSSNLVKAVSCIKQSHLDPLGLIPSQLIQRAQTANKFIKEIQLKNGLLSADQLKDGKLSPSQNFEINQMLPELKPPMSKNKNCAPTASKLSSLQEKLQTPGGTTMVSSQCSALSPNGSRSRGMFLKMNIGTVSVTAAADVSGSKSLCAASRTPVMNAAATFAAPASEAAALQLSSITKIIKNTAILSSSTKTSKAFISSPGNKSLLVPNVRVSLKPGASPTMVSVPSVLDSLPPSFSPASSLVLPGTPCPRALPCDTLKNSCTEETSSSPPTASSASLPSARGAQHSAAVRHSAFPSSSSEPMSPHQGQKRKAGQTKLTSPSKVQALNQRAASKRIQEKMRKKETVPLRKGIDVKSSASETESTGGDDESHDEDNGEDREEDSEALHVPKVATSPPQLPEAESLDCALSQALESVGATVSDVLAAQRPTSLQQWACVHPGCSTVCSKLSLLKVHLLNHVPDRPYRCSHEGCDWSFASSFKLKRHMETHLNRRDYVCEEPECGRRFSTVYNLRSHRRRHALPGPWRCLSPACGRAFSTKRLYQAHLRTHAGAQAPYRCSEAGCSKSYFTASSLTLHVRHHSRDPAELRCQWPGCGRQFDKPCRLKAHMRNHTGHRPFVCDFEGCKWSFKSSSKLTRHKRKHTNSRQFSCAICQKSFLRSEHLKGHLLLHTGVRNFSCTHPGPCSSLCL